MINNKSLGRKILRAMIALVIGLLLVAGSIFALTMKKSSDTLASSNQSLNKTIGEKSSAYMTEQSQKRMLELAGEKAEIADQIFLEFERGVCVAASVAEEIYNNPGQYAPRTVPLPDPKKDGELSIQVLYSAQTDPTDPEIVEELELIGNVQDTLMAVNASQNNMASLYVATESGFMVQADFIPAKKFDDAGNLMPHTVGDGPAKDALYQMRIGTANGTVGDFDSHVLGTYRVLRHIPDFDLALLLRGGEAVPDRTFSAGDRQTL